MAAGLHRVDSPPAVPKRARARREAGDLAIGCAGHARDGVEVCHGKIYAAAVRLRLARNAGGAAAFRVLGLHGQTASHTAVSEKRHQAGRGGGRGG